MKNLPKKWLPEIVEHIDDDELRVWISACSTGEEAYSMAMMLAEYQEQNNRHFGVKIFATDLDQVAIEKASLGVYPKSIVADVPSEYISKYFTSINILSCRNVLIYLQPILQKKILELFNFSLHREGMMILGTSESIGEMVDYFDLVSPKANLYRSKGKYKPMAVNNPGEKLIGNNFQPSYTKSYTGSHRSYSDDKTLERFINELADDVLPFTIIVDETMDVSHIFGNAKNYLTYPTGKVVTDVTKMVIKELSIPIATGTQKALKSNNEVILSNIRIREKDHLRELHLRIKNLQGKRGQPKLLAVLITEKSTQQMPVEADHSSFDIGKEASQRITDLEHELQFTRENLQATVEELETSNEELQATNEELLASNEELQSTNEELQSVNEELYTVNAEYQGKITELTLLNNDLDNLFNSTNIATLFLDENLDVRRFTPRLESIFRIMSTDVGKPFFHLSHTIDDIDIHQLVSQVASNHVPMEQEIQDANGTWYLFRIMPYAVSAHVYAGVILTFIDIDQLKQTQSELKLREQEELERLTAFVYYTEDAITLQDIKGNFVTWNHGAEKLYGWSEQEAMKMNFNDILVDESKPFNHSILEKIREGEQVHQFITQRLCKNGRIVDVSVSASMLYSSSLNRTLIAFTERDISAHNQSVKDEYVLCMQQLADIVMDSNEAMILMNINGIITAWNKGAEALYGWKHQEAVNMSFVELLPQENRAQARDYINRLIENEGSSPQQRSNVKRMTKYNQEITVNMSATLLGKNSNQPLLIITSERLIEK